MYSRKSRVFLMVILSESSTCLDLMPQYFSEVQRSDLIYRYKYLLFLFLQKMSAYYSRIILYAFRYLLFLKLSWHNLSRPSYSQASMSHQLQFSNIGIHSTEITILNISGVFETDPLLCKSSAKTSCLPFV